MSQPRKHDDIRSHAWKRARALVLATATHCALCGEPLDPKAPSGTRWASTVDHINPRSLGGSLTAANNLQAAHHGCNSRRGNGTSRRKQPKPPRGAVSRTW